MKWKTSKPLIIFLAIALAVAFTALVVTLIRLGSYVQGTAKAPDNEIVTSDEQKIGLPGEIRAVKLIQLGSDMQEFARILDNEMSTSGEQKISLTGEKQEAATPFSVSNLFPGDTVSKTYRVSVQGENVTELLFSADFWDKTANLTEAQKNRDRSLMKLCVTANGTELYNGSMDTVEAVSYPLTEGQDVTYTVTVSLDTRAGNEYANLALGMDFLWAIAGSEPSIPAHRYCPICALTRWLFGIECTSPWCWIIYILIFLHIFFFVIGSRRNKKILRNLKDEGATEEVIKEESYRKRSFIWLGIKTVISLFRKGDGGHGK